MEAVGSRPFLKKGQKTFVSLGDHFNIGSAWAKRSAWSVRVRWTYPGPSGGHEDAGSAVPLTASGRAARCRLPPDWGAGWGIDELGRIRGRHPALVQDGVDGVLNAVVPSPRVQVADGRRAARENGVVVIDAREGGGGELFGPARGIA